jgi:hypothetical protein
VQAFGHFIPHVVTSPQPPGLSLSTRTNANSVLFAQPPYFPPLKALTTNRRLGNKSSTMAQYVFPSTHSPYTTQQPVVYTTSSHSHHGNGGYTYGTPLRRATSVGHVYTPSPAYGYTTSQPAQFLTVPSTHHRSKSRHRHTSHGHHGHTSYPVTYAPTTPVYVVSLLFDLFQ